MARFLLATDSVHTTASACDFLVDRCSPSDAVTVLTVREPGSDPRDGEDALNVARVRLEPVTTVETAVGEGSPAPAILDEADATGATAIVMGPRGGVPGSGPGLGGTARSVLEATSIPVVIVPIPDLG